MALRFGIGGSCFAQRAPLFEGDPFPGLPGPAVSPEGRKSSDESGAEFILLSSIMTAQYCMLLNNASGPETVQFNVIASVPKGPSSA